MLGHTEDVCKKKNGVVRTEWRKKAPPSTEPPTVRVLPEPCSTPPPTQRLSPSPQAPPPEDFIMVSKGTSTRRPAVISEAQMSEHQNSFEALNEAHILDVLQGVIHRENQSTDPSHVTDR